MAAMVTTAVMMKVGAGPLVSDRSTGCSSTSRSFSPLSIARTSFSSVGRVRASVRSNGGVATALSVKAKSPITFHVGETSLTMPFSVEAAKGLSSAINDLLALFKEREKATRPQRWQNMEFKQMGEEGVSVEVFCNPNAYANAFQAKVLITIKDEKIKIASEGQLSALKADIDEYFVGNTA